MKKVLIGILAIGLILSGCQKSSEFETTKEKGKVQQHENNNISTSKDETNSIGDQATYPSTEEITVDSLIQNEIRIGDKAEELEKVASNQYQPEYDTYSYRLSGNLYGHISKNIIETLTIRLDSEPISSDKADGIIKDILPEDAVLIDSRKESPYIYYNYKSTSLPSPSKIEVQIGEIGGSVKVIGFTSDIGTTVYYNN